jgi:hypothetical protein
LGIKRQVGRGAWCLIGDFNAVLHSEERKGKILLNPNYMHAEVAEFSDFVRSSDLMDLPILGRKFTWFHPNGSTMSRIDRMLVNDDWLLLWNNPTLWVLPRSVSDHCSLIVRYSGFDWGPKPFRFNNHWLLNNNFHGVVEDYWRNCNFTGWMAVILKEKLKGLKSILRVWNKENYGQMDSKMNNLIEDIKRLDLKSESLGISEEEVLLRKRKFSEMWQLRRCKESTIRQQSRQTWLREGDSNSRFFHASVKSRGKRNLISALQVGETWLESPADIRQATVDNFKLKFSTVSWLRPKLDGVSFPSLSEEENCWLTRPFALEELESMVKECDGNKSPGPDGFNFAFVKALWNVFKGEIRIMFDQFHGIGSLPKSFTSYFVALIPKINSPFSLGDFRPISLLGCLYKMIAKVLTARLAHAMDGLVASTQSAFLKGRHLVDGVVVINEVVDLAKRNGKSCMIFKVDFEKAYDSVEWSFLDYMLDRFGFCSKWKDWIHACVFAGSMSVLINGSPSEEINIQRGLKQGDPLAPFLFLLVAEGLGGIMRRAVELNRFHGFRVGNNGVVVSHLQYADDTICVGEASINNLWALKAILRGFEMASGLKVNYWKSSLMGINVSQDFLVLASTFLNCKTSVVPFKYLGLPVGANPRRMTTWEPLLESLWKRLSVWGNKFVSLGGRITLLNSVLNAIPIFYLSYLKLPVQVWRKIRQIQRDFLWGGRRGSRKISWIKWDTVCLPKNKGGLGVRDVRVVNISLLAKWRWRLLDINHAVWKEVISSKYGAAAVGKVEIHEDCKPWFASLWWRDISSIGLNLDINWFSSNAYRKLGNGMQTRFWWDIWNGGIPLKDRFPRLFSISNQQNASVAEMYNNNIGGERWLFTWRRRFFVWESELFEELKDSIYGTVLSESEDCWCWRPENDAVFSVKSTYNLVSSLSNSNVLETLWHGRIFSSIWKSPTPSKVVGFVWQLLHNRIPTRSNLVSRSILAPGVDSLCPLCGEENETDQHLFLYCKVSLLQHLSLTHIPYFLFSIV